MFFAAFTTCGMALILRNALQRSIHQFGFDEGAEEVAFDAANGQVHHRQAPRRRVGPLPLDRDVADPPAMLFDELFALHKHARRAAARIVNSPLVRREHLDQHADHAARRVNLPAVLPLDTGELREDVWGGPGCPSSGSRHRPARSCRLRRSARPSGAYRAPAGQNPSARFP